MNENSLKKLSTCDERLQLLAKTVSAVCSIQVICGHRNEEDQNKAFKLGNSKLKFPKSKHNKLPSLAMDIVPDPDNNPKTLDWSDVDEFKKMLVIVEEKAKELGIKIRLGRDFSFKDYPHVELM
jgi:peptidoglycan L-alanyl-D-glutamate endopeptidase CwlK